MVEIKPCRACESCGLDITEMNFYCGNKEAVRLARLPKTGFSQMWLHIQDNPRALESACGKEGRFFKQHPMRNEDGSLK